VVMATEVRQRRFTADEYMRMVEVGILDEDDHVELLDGRIVEMGPQGDAHVATIEHATEALVPAYAGSGYAVRVQSTHRAGTYSVPEPDLVVVPRRTNRVLDVAQSLLVIEVSDTSRARDTKLKRRLYAEAGAPRYWIVDIPERRVLMLSGPQDGDYRHDEVVAEDGILTLPVVGAAIRAAEVLPAPTA